MNEWPNIDDNSVADAFKKHLGFPDALCPTLSSICLKGQLDFVGDCHEMGFIKNLVLIITLISSIKFYKTIQYLTLHNI